MPDLPPGDTPQARELRRRQEFHLGQIVALWVPHEDSYVHGYEVVNHVPDGLGRIKIKTPFSKQAIWVYPVSIQKQPLPRPLR